MQSNYVTHPLGRRDKFLDVNVNFGGKNNNKNTYKVE